LSNFKYNKMKKIILITLTVFLNMALFSCSEDDDFLTDESQKNEITQETQACCGEDGELPPPPPPPPTGGN
jgi:hypothetical protein